MRIRLTNPHAQSKDPYPATRASVASGRSPGIARPRESSRNAKRDTTVESLPFAKSEKDGHPLDDETLKRVNA